MKWKDSHKFVENLKPEQYKRYIELNQKYLDASLDGHDAHLCACEELEKELK